VVDHRQVDSAVETGAGPVARARILTPAHRVRRIVDRLAGGSSAIDHDAPRPRVHAAPFGKPPDVVIAHAALVQTGDVRTIRGSVANGRCLVVAGPVTAEVSDRVA